jgi:hypothetical protein
MKITKLKMIIPLLVMISLVCQPAIFAGEHPWDGDNSPAGGHNPGGNNGGGSGSGGDNSTTPRPMTSVVCPNGTGVNIELYIQGAFFRFATSIYSSLVTAEAKAPSTLDKKKTGKAPVSGDVK